MKLTNLFKKTEKQSSVKSNAEALTKKQLEKVIGGSDVTTQTEITESTSGQKAKAWMVNN